jgi:hypothetical protein
VTNRKRVLFRLAIVVVILLLAFVSISVCSKKSMDPEEAKRVLNLFYSDNVPESINDRYLVEAGRAIVPYLTVEVQKRDMPKRRYAILALGKLKDKRALPVLIQILYDRSELYYFRDDALRAIWHIDRKLGEEYGAKFAGQNPYMDRTIELLRDGQI